MNFTQFEIQLAKKMKQGGITWKSRIGGWYYSESGFCELVKEERQLPVVDRHTWLPLWEECREWLKKNGWQNLEFVTDAFEHVEIEITHPRLGTLGARGTSDRECLYKLILRIAAKV